MDVVTFFQLGAAAIAILGGLAAGGLWLRNRFYAIRVIAAVPQHSRWMIREYGLDREKGLILTRLAIWLRVDLVNGSSERIYVTRLLAHANTSTPREVMAPLVGEASFWTGGCELSKPLQFPLHIDSHSGVRFFCLTEVEVPEAIQNTLGKASAKMGAEEAGREFRELSTHLLSDLEQRMKDDIDRDELLKPFNVTFSSSSIRLGNLRLKVSGDQVKVIEGIATEGRDLIADAKLYLASSKPELLQAFRERHSKYYVKAELGDSRVFSTFLRTRGQFDWFTDRRVKQ